MDNPRHGVTVRRSFWVVWFTLISLGVVAGGLAYYRFEKNNVSRAQYQELRAIADLKVQLIENWRHERLGDANSMTRSPFMRQAVATWLQDPGNSGLRLTLLEMFKLMQEGYGYENIYLASPAGKILLSLGPAPAHLCSKEIQALDEALHVRHAVLGDLFRCPRDHRIYLDAAAPILDQQGRPLAVALFVIDPADGLYPLIRTWPNPSLSAETFLVELDGKDVLFLNDLRHRKKTALALREPLGRTDLPGAQAIRGKRGLFAGKDYRGVEVLADLRPMPHWPWFMVTKVDRAEVLAEARYPAAVTVLFVLLFILFTGAATAYGYRRQQAGLFQDLYRTEKEWRQTQEEFRTTLYSIGDAVITTDTAGLVKQMNQVAARLTGWPEAEAMGRPLEEVFHIINEQTRTPVENPVHRILREGQVVGLANHTLLLCRDGAEVPIADSGAPIQDESGAVLGVVLIFRDQTQERAAQKALSQSETKFRELFENMSSAVAVYQAVAEGEDFIILEVNRALERIEQVKRADLLGRKVDEVFPGVKDFGLFDVFQRVWRTGIPEAFPVSWYQDKRICGWRSNYVYKLPTGEIVTVYDDVTEQKEAEEALRFSEERYRTVADYTYDMEYWINEDGKVAYMSPSCERFTGYPPQAFLEDPQLFQRIVHPQDLDLFLSHMHEVYSGAEELEFDFRLLHRNGQEYWVSHSCQPVFGKDGRPLGRRASNRDITERKWAEEALRESEEKYRLLVSQIPAVVFQGYGDWSVNFFDQKIEALTGYLKEEFNSRRLKWSDLILPEDLEQASRTFIYALNNDKSYQREYRMRRKDGTIRWVQAMGQIFLDAAGKVDHVSGVFFDITERKQAEQALREQTYFLQTLIDTIPSPIFYKNLQGVYLGCNRAFKDFMGVPKEEIIGRTVHELYPEDLADKYFAKDQELFQNPGVQIYDFIAQYADGTRHDVNFNKATYFTADGKLAGLVGVMIDITERKGAEAERLRFSKLESLATLAGGIAHDFNNILTGIMGNISLAMLDQPQGPIRKNLAEAERACTQAQKLSRQLLTFAKGGAPIKELVPVADLVSETVSFTCTGSKARYTFNFPDDLWALEADPGQINQVIQNLAINALQAMPTGGTIAVKGENLVVEAESDLPLEAGKYVKISLKDQGVGIPADHLLRIFDPYFTTKQTGSGLGLATAYSVVQSHHGYISVESTLGEGTTFNIYLPALAQRIEPPDQRGEVMTGQGKILVMDDEDMVRRTLEKMLGRLGYQVVLAEDGAEALELFSLARKSGQHFAAVILDLTVPGGLGGRETMEILLKVDPQVKALVSSGYSEDAIMAEFENYGFSGVIAKPYRIAELGRVLHKVLQKDT
jgi:PAS domain S-box-containing protein